MKRIWTLVPVLAVIIVLLAIPRLVLLPKVVNGLESALADALHTEEVNLSITAPWGWELLLGRIPSLSFSARRAQVEGVEISRVEVQGEELLFEPWLLFRQGELSLTRVSELTGSLVITEDALNEFFWREVDPSRLLMLEVWPHGLAVAGTVNIWNMDVSVRILGDLVVHDGSTLRFVVKDLAVQDTRIPPLLLEILKESYVFAVELGEFPLPLELRAVEHLEHEIRISIGGQP
jgi:hypothetical protein